MRKMVFWGSVAATVLLPFPFSLIPAAFVALTIDVLRTDHDD